MATLFTFLPPFLFILLGAPAVEATRHEVGFTAPLTAITAAVVGVILNLAVFFAYHVLWPQGFGLDTGAGIAAGFEWFAAIIGVLAFVALFRFTVPIVPVLAACAALGLAYSVF